MFKRKVVLFSLLVIFLGVGGCALLSGSTLCTKGNTKQGLFLDYGSAFDYTYVTIQGSPNFRPSDKYVKKMIVDNADGFLLIYDQGVVRCDNVEEMKKNPRARCKGHKVVKKYIMKRYTHKIGYEEWSSGQISEEDWKNVSDLYHSFHKKPDYHYENCRYHFFGGITMFLDMISNI